MEISMNPASDVQPIILGEVDALPEGVKFIVPLYDPDHKLNYGVQERVRLWHQPRPPAPMYVQMGYAIVRGVFRVTFPSVLEFAPQVPEIQRHGFCMDTTKAMWLSDTLEDRYGPAAVQDGAAYVIFAMQAV